jgi:hypothetical protein
MSDWQVGDLALCIENMPCDECGVVTNEVSIGATYRVGDIMEEDDNLWLFLPEVPPTNHEHWPPDPWYRHTQFRKIRPDEQEACEPEFASLLKRSKVSA